VAVEVVAQEMSDKELMAVVMVEVHFIQHPHQARQTRAAAVVVVSKAAPVLHQEAAVVA
jgi:hypothetical protein